MRVGNSMHRWFLSFLIFAVYVPPAAARLHTMRDPQTLHPGLRAVSVVCQEARKPGGALVETAREHLLYDADGRLIQHENHGPDGRLDVRMTYVFDERGRLAQSRYQDHTGRIEIRRYTYKLEKDGRISERDLHNPASPPGEFIRDLYTWEDDGGHTIRSYRHYAKEGPYPDGSESYDRTGRLKTRCSTGHCELYEYDPHGEISRVREQNSETHYYRVHENEYDPAGRLARERIGGTQSFYQYDARGNITQELRQSSGSPTTRMLYTYEYRGTQTPLTAH